MRVRVYLRPKTVLVLLARKDMQHGGQKWLAMRIGVSQTLVSLMINGQSPVPSGRQGQIMEAFRGMSHKRGGRLTWDDVFQSTMVDSVASL